jgi:(2Fe-2S) ferredoxin
MIHTLFVCQNRTCVKQGAKRVLAELQKQSFPGCSIVATGCLGHCGSGPNLCIQPENIWHCHVYPDEVKALVERHLLEAKSVEAID